MNDPGLDSSLNDAVQDLEHSPYEHLQQQEEEEEQDFLDPRYVRISLDLSTTIMIVL